jgi:hypothetical protein
MSIMVAIVLALAGAVALLAGVADRRRSGRLRSTGAAAWAMAIARPGPDAERTARQRPYLQYTIGDGRVVEQVCPGSIRKAARLKPGERVLVWYDPANPADVLVFGRDTRRSDWAFIITGLAFILIGAVIGAVS